MSDTKDVSATCEVLTLIDHNVPERLTHMCGQPTAYWYPSMGGGTMALCETHAQKHLSYASAISMVPLGGAPAPEKAEL